MTLILDRDPLRRSLHVSPRLGVAYVNNPKVACSTLKLTLQQAELDDPSYAPPGSVHDHLTSPLLCFPQIGADQADPLDALAGRFVFSFVRNPYERIRSAYLNKILRPPPRTTDARDYAGFRRDYCPSFEEFLEALHDPAILMANAHWRPQVMNLSLDAIAYDFIGRLESFDADWAALSVRTGLPALPSRAGDQVPRRIKNRIRYTGPTARMVKALYAEDFARLGYDTGLGKAREIPPFAVALGR